MVEITWTDQAEQDLNDIADFISRDSVLQAEKVVNELLTLVADIPNSPFLGRSVPELNQPNIRERILYQYRIVYKISGKSDVLLLTLLHSRRSVRLNEKLNEN